MQGKGVVVSFILACIAWAIVASYWYSCGIKGFCPEYSLYKEDNSQKVVPIQERSDTRVPQENKTSRKRTTQEEVTITCDNYLDTFVRYGYQNNTSDVRKLEEFLNQYEGEELRVDGVFSREDERAVMRFQAKYAEDIMHPWGVSTPSGYVYITTRNYINALYCAYNYRDKQ